jgi:hypothetical protein
MTLAYGLFVLALVACCAAPAQTITDQGLLSGSGMSFLPTASLVPLTEFRVQTSRVGYLSGGRSGFTVFGLGVGISTHIEGYLRATAEQTGVNQSQIAYAFGAKARIPVPFPVLRRAALWAERSSSEQFQSGNIFSPEATRIGVLATSDSNGIHPTVLLGFTSIRNLTRPLVGAGVTIAAGSESQVSLEVMHGYFGRKSVVAAAGISHRFFSNVSLNVTPGYLTTPSASTWMISAGISVTTTGIDFHPAMEPLQEEPEFRLPTIEEMERGTASDVPATDSTTVTGTQSSTYPGTLENDGTTQPTLPVDGPTIDAPQIDGPAPGFPMMDEPMLNARFQEGDYNREEEHHEE